MEIDWDEEEMATQVFDRPEAIAKALSTPPPPPPAAGRSRTQMGPGGVPALPAIPGVPSLPGGRPPTSTSMGVAPPPSSSLPSAPPMSFPGPPPSLTPAVRAPAVAAPPITPAPLTPPPPAPPLSQPSNPPSLAKDPYRIGEAPRPSARPSGVAQARPEATRKKDNTSMVVLAGLGVVAVAAAVVLGLKLTRGDATGALLITTNVGGVTVLVDGQPQIGNGQRFDVQELPANRSHSVEVRKTGFRSFQQQVPVREGATTPMEVVLEPEPSTVAVPPIAEPAQVLAAANPAPTPTPSAPAVTPEAAPPPVQQLAPPPEPTPAPTPAPAPAPAPARAARAVAPRVASAPRPARTVTPRPTPTPVAAAAPRPSGGGENGTLLISTRPASTCSIPGQGGSFGTPRRLNLPAGSYTITCINDELNARSLQRDHHRGSDHRPAQPPSSSLSLHPRVAATLGLRYGRVSSARGAMNRYSADGR
ncbi:MAG: PEGA domain-containing protein [Polyangiales bacterium]